VYGFPSNIAMLYVEDKLLLRVTETPAEDQKIADRGQRQEASAEDLVRSFLPSTDIDHAVLKAQIGSVVPGARLLDSGSHNGKQGYWIEVPRNAKNLKEAIMKLMEMSRKSRKK
jgi:hypothetical protein